MHTTMLIGALTAMAQAQPTSISFTYTDAVGIGLETGVCRRDPSDVICVDSVYYVWYSRLTDDEALYPSGYRATVWYATSTDEGRTWTEQGEAVGTSEEGYDSCAVFTPNILAAEGRYYLAYTAVAKGFTNEEYIDINRTAIGMAVADSPAGPWTKLSQNPIIESTDDPQRFDSFRVDDSCFIVRDGRYWLYYKGRQWERTPRETQMGVAVAEKPEGPYVRLNDGEPVQDSGHEVLVWPDGEHTYSIASDTGPNGRTLQRSVDGTLFKVTAQLPDNFPRAPGLYRPDLTDQVMVEGSPQWGISMVHGPDPYLVRYEMRLTR